MSLVHEADFRNLYQSSTVQYNNLAERDFAQLDYIDVDAPSPVLREPCVDCVEPVTGQTTVAPFAWVTDQSGDAVCDLISTKYSGMKNSQILQAQTPTLIPSANLGWQELYAISFAFEVHVKDNPDDGADDSAINGVMGNNYFQCARAYADVVDNLSGTAAPSNCGTAPPAFYQAILGH